MRGATDVVVHSCDRAVFVQPEAEHRYEDDRCRETQMER
jgi:hypothetical protein